ncbi:MAG TPA: hypothetical protein VJN18_19390 [Polyangiaceae bacterium]|nr:hypothetical protein [Polyangiaceae bacterium]
MGETIPPESKSQPASERDEDDPHESVTIAPPAPSFDEILRRSTPVPSLSQRSDLRVRAALDAGNRAGLSLSELSKMAAELSGGVIGAKRANEQLVEELATLRAMLGAANEQQVTLKHRLAQLEQELSAAHQQAERERQFLTDQHDDFLAALLDEHEEALRAAHEGESDTRRMDANVSDLAQKLVQTEAARMKLEAECRRAHAALTEAQLQRDEAQSRAQAHERERDELRAETSMLRARLGATRSSSSATPPVVASRPPSFRPPGALELDAGELDSTLHSGRPVPPRPYTPRPVSVPPSPTSDTPEAFPRRSTRPGVGGPKPSEPPPPPDFGPPLGWMPPPPPPEPAAAPVASTAPRPPVMSAASIPPSQVPKHPVLKQKPDHTSRPLISYSLGEDGVASETLEGARVSSKPPRK